MQAVVVKDVTRTYVTCAEPLHVLRGCSLNLESGDSMAILGPSGSGKSTLLAIMGTLDSPSSGSVAIAGINPFSLPEPELAAFRNRHIGFVFQDHYLLPQCSALENVLIPTLASTDKLADWKDRAESLLVQVGLANRLHHRPAELSGGERQRVALARAMVLAPQLLLADEPTGNLDRTTASSVSDLLLGLHAQWKTALVVVTHSLDLARRFNRQYELNEGVLASATS